MKTELLPDEFLIPMADVIRMIGHPQRLRILEYLDLHGESTVGAIVKGVGGQQGAVSQHLNRMRMAEIVVCRREGRQMLYRIGAVNAVTILNCLRNKYRSMQ
ncbi:MAG: metalloregulator ArsR/SmtB family transcription factor [Victivallales bacterium]|jgi:transcriptional regulator, arsR family